MRLTFTVLLASIAIVASAQVWEKSLAPGLVYRMEVAEGPRLIHALRISPKAPDLRLSAELAGGTINEAGTVKGRLSPAKIAEQTRGIAALNADFFSFDHGAPIGLTVRNGELLNTPFKSRSVLAWGRESGFGMPAFRGSLSVLDGPTFAIDSVNQVVGQNQIALYTSAAGTVDVAADNLMALITIDRQILRPQDLVDGTVEYLISDTKTATVPAGKVLIVARGNKAPLLATLRPEQKVKVKVETQGLDWTKYENAIGGGPMLVSEGRVAVDAAAQGFAASFSEGRHPRSAVGRTKEGDIWLVAIDGRQLMSIGASLRETAEVMLALGCTDAMNLDGGGSTNLHLLGVTVNRPSDKSERPVSNALVIFGKVEEAAKGTASIKLPPQVKPGDIFEAKFLLDGKELPHSDVIWSMQGAGWMDQGGLVRAVEVGRATIRAYARGILVAAEVTIAKPTIDKIILGAPKVPASNKKSTGGSR